MTEPPRISPSHHISSHDWSTLPKDILNCIFDRLFSPPCIRIPCPIKDLYSLHVQVSLVCRHWNSALRTTPPSLSALIDRAPRYVLDKWLPSFPVHHICLSPFNVEYQSSFEDQSSEDSGPQRPTPLVPLGTYELARFRDLQVLEVSNANAFQERRFTCAKIAALKSLMSLTLRGYLDYDLEGLPSSVRLLTLAFGPQEVPLSSRDISVVPSLPKHRHSLEKLSIETDGTVGLPMDQVWNCCFEVDVYAKFVLVGVPVADESLITYFERPYREGAYVPPHILGDWDAVEASNAAALATTSDFLTALARCPTLRSLIFRGECSNSIKMVPGIAGRLQDAILWLHSVTHQATFFLYGMSGPELLDRAIDLRSTGLLDHDAVDICLEDLSSVKRFQILVKK